MCVQQVVRCWSTSSSPVWRLQTIFQIVSYRFAPRAAKFPVLWVVKAQGKSIRKCRVCTGGTLVGGRKGLSRLPHQDPEKDRRLHFRMGWRRFLYLSSQPVKLPCPRALRV